MINIHKKVLSASDFIIAEIVGSDLYQFCQCFGIKGSGLSSYEIKENLFQIIPLQQILASENRRSNFLWLLEDLKDQIQENLNFDLDRPRWNKSQIESFVTFCGEKYIDEDGFDDGKDEDDFNDGGCLGLVNSDITGLYPYQTSALAKVRRCLSGIYLRDNPNGNQAVILHMPTGSGKTRTAMNYVCDYLREDVNRVAVWLASTEELCDQAYKQFKKLWPHLGSREVQVMKYWGHHTPDLSQMRDGLAVIGLAKANNSDQVRELGGLAPLVVFDEAHQAIAPTYKKTVEALLSLKRRDSRRAQLLGLTATPGRTVESECDVLAKMFNRKIVTLDPGPEYQHSAITYLEKSGYLACPTFNQLKTNVDIQSLLKECSYTTELSAMSDLPYDVLRLISQNTTRNLIIMDRVLELLSRYKRILVFAPSVETSNAMSTAIRLKYGEHYDAESLTSSSVNRKNIIEKFKSNNEKPMVLFNYGILTTGFDAPKTEAVVIARPTTSLTLYSQMVGRALRGKNVGGTAEAEIWTVVDKGLEAFYDMKIAFTNWSKYWEQQ